MAKPKRGRRSRQAGFSLIELVVVMGILVILVGVAMQQINQMQQRAQTENVKLDMFQEGREFMDQFARDMHQVGYPSYKQFDTASFASPAAASPLSSDNRIAAGITSLSTSEIIFEGDVDGDGQVDVLDYKLYYNSGSSCPCTLKRSQVLKSAGGTNFSTEVQNVQSEVFSAFDATGAAISLPASTANLPNIKTVQITLNLKAALVDMQTRQAPETSLTATVNIVNCNLVSSGGTMSCQ